MLDFFRLSKDGRHYRRLVQGFQRIFAATIFFGTEDQPGGSLVVDWARFHFFDRMQLWFNATEPRQPATNESFENTVTLSEAFYKEIDSHRVPVEREVIAALAHAPGILDLYVWMVWKSWTLNGSRACVPLFAPCGLGSQLGTTEYSAKKRFRQAISDWIVKVRALWPDCPAEISEDGTSLIVRSSRKCPAIRSVEKPVNLRGDST
jgi:hypothetical protein